MCLDDIVIHSDSYEDHMKHLESVFSRLRKHNLKVKLSKAIFFQQRFTYLGHEFSEEGIRPAPENAINPSSVPLLSLVCRLN